MLCDVSCVQLLHSVLVSTAQGLLGNAPDPLKHKPFSLSLSTPVATWLCERSRALRVLEEGSSFFGHRTRARCC